MKQLLFTNYTEIQNYFNNKPSAPYSGLLKIDSGVYSEKDVKKLLKRVEKFNEPTNKKKFKFTTFKSRKSSKEIKFKINVTAIETDDTIIAESKKVHAKNLEAEDNKLNYYRKT